MNTLLLEIGTEEIPAGYIAPALDELSTRLLKRLDDSRITYDECHIYGTPRRLSVMVTRVASKQTSVTSIVMGPPERVAFDENKNPLVPAVKFAEKLGVGTDKLTVTETDKGRYLSATLVEKGDSTKTILKTILPAVILSIPFPKTMRWADSSLTFARPIQSIMALLGKETVVFNLGHIKSSRYTYGHRFMSPGKINIISPETYLDQLKAAYVMCEIDRRKDMIRTEINKAAGSIQGNILPDEELVSIVTQLVEYPAVAVGKFDKKFLKLPDEILITSMREHQKYFAVSGTDNTLLPNFIVVNNTPAKDMSLVAKGHERVLRARLEDAMFFYENDFSDPLENNVERLKGVLFQAKLGSMFDKTLRIQRLSKFIAEQVSDGRDIQSNGTALIQNASRAAFLCKADLVSQVVVEFPKLQGIMGRVYAAKDGETDDVSSAIEEHYRPTYSGGALPKTLTGSVVAIADKIDSISGCFSVGLIPSGASDPYALRRQGIGIILILEQQGLSFPLSDLIQESLKNYLPDNQAKIDEIFPMVYAFFKDRMANILVEQGFSKDVVTAVTEVPVDCIPDVWKKTEALNDLKKLPDFEPIAVAFKRVVNIIKKSGLEKTADPGATVNPDLFEDKSETELHQAVLKISTLVTQNMAKGLFDKALLNIAELRNPVDDFFDGVLVMAENENIRNNRLALLGMIAALFENLADFSKLST